MPMLENIRTAEFINRLRHIWLSACSCQVQYSEMLTMARIIQAGEVRPLPVNWPSHCCVLLPALVSHKYGSINGSTNTTEAMATPPQPPQPRQQPATTDNPQPSTSTTNYHSMSIPRQFSTTIFLSAQGDDNCRAMLGTIIASVRPRMAPQSESHLHSPHRFAIKR